MLPSMILLATLRRPPQNILEIGALRRAVLRKIKIIFVSAFRVIKPFLSVESEPSAGKSLSLNENR
jgi:hypothetical protein